MFFTKKYNLFIFWGLIITAGLLKVFYPSDLYWDLANYHYYNAWAFFNGRLGYDIAPAMVHTYFNPLLDVPYYLMLNVWTDMPSLIRFCQGTYYGILVFVFYKICCLYFNVQQEWLAVLITVLIGATGFAALAQAGTSSNEVQVSILILWGLYLILQAIDNEQRRKRVWIYAGLLMGAALGFKPTVIIYCVATGLSLILFKKPLKVSVKEIMIFALSGLVGYLIVNGWWMWQLYSHFDNPFFPFLNKIFKSEYFELINYRDTDYIDKTTWWQKLWLPLFMLSKNYVNDSFYFDIRFALVYVVMIITFFKWVCCDRVLTNSRYLLLYALIGISYIVWVYLFSIVRYTIPIEMLSAIVIVKFFQKIRAKGIIREAVILSVKIIGVYALLSEAPDFLDYYNTGNDNFSKLYESIEQQVNIPQDALIKTYGYPSSMVAARIVGDKPNRIINFANGYDNSNCRFVENSQFKQERDLIEQQHQGPVVAIISYNYFSRTSALAEINAFLARQRKQQLEQDGMYCRLFILIDKIDVCVQNEYKDLVFVKKTGM